jgi:hypothetical protein
MALEPSNLTLKFDPFPCSKISNSSIMPIPAISGAETKTFDTMFWKGVTEKQLLNRKTIPFKGSIGVFWQVYKDIRELGVAAIKDQKVNKLYPRQAEDGKLITTVNAKALKGFYEWAEQTADPLFFIKKGTQPLWLCKKVGGYYYEDKPEDHFWHPHRIHFEFVRFATESEGTKRLGIGLNTMIWIEMDPLPKLEAPVQVEMPPKKKVEEPKVAEEPIAEQKKAPIRKSRAKPKPKEATAVQIPEPIQPSQKTIHPTYAETEEEPLEVEQIKVQAFELDGTHYFREPIKNKLYKRLANGSPGPYIGRYSPKDLQLHEEVEDSDREDDF